jgi:hypothetical protein
MSAVVRLVTLVDVSEEAPEGAQMSVSARHEAELENGRRVLLLDDRGWTSSARTTSSRPEDQPDVWAVISAEEIEETARFVVGPDEPAEGRSQEDAEADHWACLAGVLRQQGITVDALELKRLPHDVVLSEPLRARMRLTNGGK